MTLIALAFQSTRAGQQPNQELLCVLLEWSRPALQAAQGTPSQGVHRRDNYFESEFVCFSCLLPCLVVYVSLIVIVLVVVDAAVLL